MSDKYKHSMVAPIPVHYETTNPMFPPSWKPVRAPDFRTLAREALELLREREWLTDPDYLGGEACHTCGSREPDPGSKMPTGHAPDCQLARVLRELEVACG